MVNRGFGPAACSDGLPERKVRSAERGSGRVPIARSRRRSSRKARSMRLVLRRLSRIVGSRAIDRAPTKRAAVAAYSASRSPGGAAIQVSGRSRARHGRLARGVRSASLGNDLATLQLDDQGPSAADPLQGSFRERRTPIFRTDGDCLSAAALSQAALSPTPWLESMR